MWEDRIKPPIQEGYVTTTNGKADWKLRINHPEWGRFFIKVTDPVSGHAAGQVVAVDWPGWANGNRDGLDGVAMLSLTADKEEYQLGETVKLNFPSSAGGRALVSLETGSKVVKTMWVETDRRQYKC